MQDFNNDDVKKMLEMLREHAESTPADASQETDKPQTTENSIHTDDDIKNMLKKHFSAAESDGGFEVSEDYSFDTVDFGKVDDEVITGELEAVTGSDEDTDAEAETSAEIEEIEEVENIEEIEEIEEIENVEESVDSPSSLEEHLITAEIDDEPKPLEIAPMEQTGDVFENWAERTLRTLGEVSALREELDLFAPAVHDEAPEQPEAEEEPEVEGFVDKSELSEIFTERPIKSEAEEVPEEIPEEAEEAEEVAEDVSENSEIEASEPDGIPGAEYDEPEQVLIDMGDADAHEDPCEEVSEPEAEAEEGAEPEAEEIIEQHEDPISEESINYDEVLEGQQGTVFNSFVEDFTGDLDDVVFEAEITESRAPDKQYTIFEDWERLMKDKNYATAEDGIIPPTPDELEHSRRIQATGANTDYFDPVTSADLDAVDIALMVALGGESEIGQTVGFEKIRQAVETEDTEAQRLPKNKKIFGYCGEEYTSLSQNAKIREKYKKDKTGVIARFVITAVFTLALLAFEVASCVGIPMFEIVDAYTRPDLHVLAGLQMLFFIAVLSLGKFKKLFADIMGFSSISFIAALAALALSVHHDVLLLTMSYAPASMTFHSFSAILFLLGTVYDLFDIVSQSGAFEIVSSSDKKLVLEPYGRLRVDDHDNNATGEILDSDSYCISRVPSLNKYFERTAKHITGFSSRILSLILSVSMALCVMLVLLLMEKSFATIMLSFIITMCVTLTCAAIFESEFAFFSVYRILKRYKTGIVGKASVSEYGKCNIVYFDDYNVFNKKSVRTKGLKLYDNNEIYRVLYHTQAVFSKVGGPLKGVFEFATSEMIHSKNVEIREIKREGICAMVDGRTSVLIGTGNFMKSRGIHPSYTASDLKIEERADESIMFIALNGSLGAKLYVTYQFSSEFEKLARKLADRGVGVGIRSSDPNINLKWAKRYGTLKKFDISIVRPTLKELSPSEKSIDGGVVSVKNVRALSEALMMCIKLDAFESIITKVRTVAVVLMGILTFALVLLSGINIVSMLSLALALALCASIMVLLTHFYIKH